jgi:hypothetical protein
MKLTLLFTLISQFCVAGLLKYERKNPTTREYDYHTVCSSELKVPVPLVEEDGSLRLNCMGKAVWVKNFCEKKTKTDPYWIRSYVDTEKKKVICESSRRVYISYGCEKNDGQCLSSEIGCSFLQDSFAKRLELEQSLLSYTVRGKKILKCYFGPRKINNISQLNFDL